MSVREMVVLWGPEGEGEVFYEDLPVSWIYPVEGGFRVESDIVKASVFADTRKEAEGSALWLAKKCKAKMDANPELY
jgi:hypothetical protein